MMPAYPDVPESLKRLRAKGIRMVTLTNSSPSAVKEQLHNAGLTQYFDESISVDSSRRYKPDLAVYRSAATHLGAQPRELLLIAAHPWDVFRRYEGRMARSLCSQEWHHTIPAGSQTHHQRPRYEGHRGRNFEIRSLC